MMGLDKRKYNRMVIGGQRGHCPYGIVLLMGLFLFACTPTTTPTPNIPAVSANLSTSTPLPTPQQEFVTPTNPPAKTSTTDNATTATPVLTAVPELVTFTGSLRAQGDEGVPLYNGPEGLVKETVSDASPITVLGRSDDGLWLEVRLNSGIGGWVQTSNVITNAQMGNLLITGYVPQESPTPSPDLIVKNDAAGLRLRTQPNTTDSNVLANLDAGSELTAIGRDRDTQWVQVITEDRQRGWVMLRFVDVYVDVLRLPVTFGRDPVVISTGEAVVDEPVPVSADPIVNITDNAKAIYDRGVALGNRPTVFSKIGDSITVGTWAFYPIGWGQQQLGSYGYLQPAIDYFSAEIVRDGNNSFSNIPLAADNQWTTNDLLDPAKGDPAICGGNESPLDCEFRIVRPSIALIMIGTNDVGIMDGANYRRNLEAILDKTIARNILPVLSTLPRRAGYEAQIDEFNGIIRTTAGQYQIPIWQYHEILAPLPNTGLDADGLHPSYPPVELGQWEAAVNFIGDNLNYGYNQRNLTALMVLDSLWRRVILGE